MFKALTIFAFLAFPMTLEAQQFVETYGDWSVYRYNLSGKNSCYAGTVSKQSKGSFRNRSEPYFLVSLVADGTSQINASSGYYYKERAKAILVIDGIKFDLLTRNKNAWAPNSKADADIINLISKSSYFTLSGVSTRDTSSSDIFSSLGFEKAFAKIKEGCGQ